MARALQELLVPRFGTSLDDLNIEYSNIRIIFILDFGFLRFDLIFFSFLVFPFSYF